MLHANLLVVRPSQYTMLQRNFLVFVLFSDLYLEGLRLRPRPEQNSDLTPIRPALA